MTFGTPGIESFRRAIVRSRNQHITALLMPFRTFREEVISNDDLQARAGIDNTTRDHFLAHLVQCDRVRRRLTYNPSNLPLGELIKDAIDTDKTVETDSNPLGGDKTQGQSGAEFDLPFHFDGADENFPPLSKIVLNAPVGILILQSIDQTMVVATRLESRHRTRFITQMDSMRIFQGIQQIHEALTSMGGDNQQVDITNPLPTDEPEGPESSPNRVTESGGSKVKT